MALRNLLDLSFDGAIIKLENFPKPQLLCFRNDKLALWGSSRNPAVDHISKSVRYLLHLNKGTAHQIENFIIAQRRCPRLMVSIRILYIQTAVASHPGPSCDGGSQSWEGNTGCCTSGTGTDDEGWPRGTGRVEGNIGTTGDPSFGTCNIG